MTRLGVTQWFDFWTSAPTAKRGSMVDQEFQFCSLFIAFSMKFSCCLQNWSCRRILTYASCPPNLRCLKGYSCPNASEIHLHTDSWPPSEHLVLTRGQGRMCWTRETPVWHFLILMIKGDYWNRMQFILSLLSLKNPVILEYQLWHLTPFSITCFSQLVFWLDTYTSHIDL